MKKSKLLSIFLAMTLVVTTIFAGTESIFAESDAAISSSTMKAMAQVGNGGTIQANDLNNRPASSDIAHLTYSNTPATLNIVVPKAGMVQLELLLTQSSYLSLYNESSSIVPGTTSTSFSDSVYIPASANDQDVKYAYFNCKTPGTYQLSISAYGNSEALVIADYVSAISTALAKNKVYYGTSPNNSTRYYKVTAPGNGYFTLEFTSAVTAYPSFDVKLANSSKKNLLRGYENIYYYSSSPDYNYKTYYGVKKGTYYIAIKTNTPIYGFKVKYTTVSEKSGSSKSKARSLTKGNTKKGIISATQSGSSGDWYKFKITRRQKVRINVSAKTSSGGSGYGGLHVGIYQAGRSYAEVTETLSKSKPAARFNLVTNYATTLAPGTYYIKVQRYNKGNGQYTIKWL